MHTCVIWKGRMDFLEFSPPLLEGCAEAIIATSPVLGQIFFPELVFHALGTQLPEGELLRAPSRNPLSRQAQLAGAPEAGVLQRGADYPESPSKDLEEAPICQSSPGSKAGL
uniref:Bm8257 n=1 Tax=Brugia malayi TaxID=6279 RepID=A0A1I9GBX9_BRUMA|nr:Bm8257 [Brugia malayi]